MNRATILIFSSILLCGPSLKAFNTVNNTDQYIIVHSNTSNAGYTEVVKPHSTSNGWYYTGPAKEINLEVKWCDMRQYYNNNECIPTGKAMSCTVPPHGQQTVTGTPSSPPIVSCN